MSEDRAIVSQELPPLPYTDLNDDGFPRYTADDMQAYARTAVEAAILKEREECAALVEWCGEQQMADPHELKAVAAAIRARK